MSKIETKTQKGIGILFIFLGGFFTLLTLYPLFQFSQTIGYLLVVLLFGSGLLMLIGGISTFNKAKAIKVVEQIVVKHANTSVQSTGSTVASWSVDTDLWKRFAQMENRNRSYELIGMFLGIVILGTGLIMFSRDAGFLIALAVSIAVGLIVIFVKSRLTKRFLNNNGNAVSIYFISFGVVVNNEYYPFWSEVKWLHKVEQKLESDISFLEFTIKWKTRKGITQDEIRIPYDSAIVKDSVIHELLNFYTTKITDGVLANSPQRFL